MQTRDVRRLLVAGGLLLAVVGLLGLSPLAKASGRNDARIEGSLLAVDLIAGTVTIQNRAGSFVVTTNAATKIERNGRKAALAVLRIGDRAQARLSSTASNLALKLESVGP